MFGVFIGCYFDYLPCWYLWRCWKEMREKSVVLWFCLPDLAVIQSDLQQMEGQTQLPTRVTCCQATNMYYFCPSSGCLYLWNQRGWSRASYTSSFICTSWTRTDNVKGSPFRALLTWEVQIPPPTPIKKLEERIKKRSFVYFAFYILDCILLDSLSSIQHYLSLLEKFPS